MNALARLARVLRLRNVDRRSASYTRGLLKRLASKTAAEHKAKTAAALHEENSL